MVRFIMPVILIGISVAVFLMFFSPFYKEIQELRAQAISYDTALANSKALENERDVLTAKDNAISLEDKIKLRKLLPDNVDNIRLILEIEQIALPYGMPLKDIKYSPAPVENDTGEVVSIQGVTTSDTQNYGVWDLEFSTTGSYNNFLNFTRDLEKNLRIVDVSSIAFTSDDIINTSTGPTPSSNLPESYTYNFKIKTYWLKD